MTLFRLIKATLFALLMAMSTLVGAATLTLPPVGQSVVGQVQYVEAQFEDTLSDIGRRFGIGYEEMITANPGVDSWLPGAGTRVTIPSQFVLPDTPREGIVINLPEHRLYYFPPADAKMGAVVVTYPISVGKMDWTTPLGLTRVVDKRIKPSWTPPESVRKEHEEEGRPLPKIVPAGPDNPLGEYAMRLGIPGGSYLIHGTNKPIAVGMPVTHGCIRMFPEDIEQFFKIVKVNTPVRIVHQTLKAGFAGEQLYLEVHPPLEGSHDSEERSLTNVTRVLVAAMQGRTIDVDWQAAEKIFIKASGVPELLRPNQSSNADAIAHAVERE